MFQSYYAGDDVGVFIHEEFHHLILSERGAKNSFYICIERERVRERERETQHVFSCLACVHVE